MEDQWSIQSRGIKKGIVFFPLLVYELSQNINVILFIVMYILHVFLSMLIVNVKN